MLRAGRGTRVGMVIVAVMLLSAWCGGNAGAQPGLRVWGDNYSGQLGLGDYLDRSSPQNVAGLTGVIKVVCGRFHTLALKANGTVWAWGLNNFGQLGDGTTTSRSTPAPVPGLTQVIAIAAGLDHNLALKSDGTVWVWGQNYNGQLGDGTNTNIRTAPIQVSGISGVTAITGGGYHSHALKADGSVWGWGWNVEGQVGSGSLTEQRIPTRVVGPEGIGFLNGVVAIGDGHYHSVAIKADGTVWAWGWNSDGQLGNGDYFGGGAPIQMVGIGGVGTLTDITGVSSGGFHTLLLRNDGTVLACGGGFYGQLGDGTYDSQLAPIVIPALSGVTALAAGGYHNLVLLADGSVKSWGWNSDGQIGNGTTDDQLEPTTISGLGAVYNISAGQQHSLLLTAPDVIVSGMITLEDIVPDAGTQNITAEFVPLAGGSGFTRTLSVEADGAFLLDDIPGEFYQVHLKGAKWLARSIALDATIGNVADVTVVLLAGDANDDNSVDVLDLDVLIQAFDSVPFSPKWDAGSDFNCDYSVDVLDLDLLIRNFDARGDE